MRWLMQFVWRERRAAFAALISGFIGGAAQALQPYLAGTIVDTFGAVAAGGANAEAARSSLPGEIALFLLIAAVVVIAFFGQRYYSGVVSYGVTYSIRRLLFDNLLTLEQAFFQRNATGDLLSRMHLDIDAIWRMLTMTFVRGGSALFSLGLTFILLGTINLPLTLIVFVVLTISTAFQARAGLAITPIFEESQAQAGLLAGFVQDIFSGILAFKAFAREQGTGTRFAEQNRAYRRKWLAFKRRNEPVGLLPNAIAELTAGIVVVAGGVLALQGQLSLGDFARFLISLNLISTVLLQLGMIYQRWQQGRGALARLTLLLQPAQIRSETAEPERTGTELHGEFHGEIAFEGIGVRMGEHWALRDVSLRIPAGSVVGFVGATGSGKTLLLSLIARILDPNEGRVLFDGVDVRQLPLEDLRAAIAYVPQATFLFSRPLHENVRMGRGSIADEELDRAIHIARMSNDLEQLPLGLETLVGEKGVMLSGGQKQRVAIARALIRDPAVLVLDDALSSVDTQTAADILHDLRGVLRQRTSLIVAHRLATVKDADFIVVMDDGHIVEQGTHADLIARGGMYAQMAAREAMAEREDVDAAASALEAGD